MIADGSRYAPKNINIKFEDLPSIHSLEAEKCVLGSFLSDPEGVADYALLHLKSEDFFHPAHRELFGVLKEMHDGHKPIDATTVLQALDDRNLSESLGGAALLSDLASGVLSVLTARAHIDTVRDKSTLRRLQHACAETVYDIQSRAHDVRGVVDQAQQKVLAIAPESSESTIHKAKDAIGRVINMIEAAAKRKSAYQGVPSGFDQLDKLTTGFKPGEMIVIAARPGVGKTAFALSMAANMLKQRYDDEAEAMVRPGHPVAFFSLEMTAEQLLLRMIASMGQISLQKIREGRLDAGLLNGISNVAAEVGDLPLFIDESSLLSITQLRAKARRMRKDYKIDIVIIDYLQLLTSSSEKAKENRQVEVAEISRGIKALAMELKIPVVVLAQLNRKPEEGKTEPALHHLRESGSIEQDADAVIFLSRKNTRDAGEDDEAQAHVEKNGIPIEVHLAKQRNGPTDKFDLLFQSAYTKFRDAPREMK
jgi:replicative DNA helicase